MYPDEQTALAWNTLQQLLAFLQMADALRHALETRFATFNESVTAVTLLPEDIWRQGVAQAQLVVEAAVVADPQNGIVGQPALTRCSLWRPAKRG